MSLLVIVIRDRNNSTVRCDEKIIIIIIIIEFYKYIYSNILQ